jgi:tetratricopeptide (TPR) repeat protein
MKNDKKKKLDFFGFRFYFPFLLILAGITAYANSFSGCFLLDDKESIVGNPNIQALWPITKIMSAAPPSAPTARPVAYFTFALNYAVSGLNVFSYHFINLVIHILAGLTLFGIVRRTLLCERLKAGYGQDAVILAFLVAVIWLVHPVQTGSVTYIVQRIESLMGLFFLLTLYSAIRVFQNRRSVIFSVLSVIFCCLGMATKEVMVTAPFMVFVYDRAFISGSFASAIRKRAKFYTGLAATWVVLAVLIWSGPRSKSAGFSFGIGAVDYARSQFAVVVHYIRLVFWPINLCLDYGWQLVKTWAQVLPQVLVITVILVVMVFGFVRNRTWSYPLVWFFVILAPTSSFVPVADLAFEHRLYLPLAGIIALVILSGYLLLGWIDKLFGIKAKSTEKLMRLKSFIGLGLGLLVILTLTGLTLLRNSDYRDEVTIWQKTLRQAPHNPRVHLSLGQALSQKGRIDEAIRHYQKAAKLKPDYAKVYYSLGDAFLQRREPERALDSFNIVLKLWPDDASVHNQVGLILYHKGNVEQAVFHFRRSLEIEPNNYLVHHNLAVALAKQGKLDEAIAHMQEAIRIEPDFSEGKQKLERLLSHKAGLNSKNSGPNN